MIVVIALYIGIIMKVVGKVCVNCRISVAGNTAKQLDTAFGERHLCTASDATADQDIRMQRVENIGKRAVPLTVGVDDAAIHYLTVLNIVNFKLLGMTEVLINVAIFVCYCNSHDIFSFIHFICCLKLPFEA